MTLEELLETFRGTPIEFFQTGPESLSLRPREAVTERIRVAVAVYKPALMWLVSRRLKPDDWARPLSEAWLTHSDHQSWQNYKARQDWSTWIAHGIRGAA